MQSYGHTSNGASNLLLSHKTYATGDKEFPSFILGACLLAACLVEGVMPVAKKKRQWLTPQPTYLSSWRETRRGHSRASSPSKDAHSGQTCALSAFVEVQAESAPATELLDSNAGAAQETSARHKHLCLYFTQGLCTLTEDATHLSKFTHSYPDLPVRSEDLKKVSLQPFDYFLVMDLEGKVEILEFPVVLIHAQTLEPVDRFHRFVRPSKMSERRIEEYIEGKYGRWGLDRVWHDTAVPFTKVLEDFEGWLEDHGLWNATRQGKMVGAAFVTCGNWDVKTKIPEQCVSSDIPLPPYFNEWINLKDIYLNHYKQRAGGMLAMLRGLKMPLTGSHHLGLDDAHNIARVLQRILCDGAVCKVTARRKTGKGSDPKAVTFTFANRVR